MKKIFYDFECFAKDWLVVLIDYDTRDKTIIINDRDSLESFYNDHKDDVFCGYNSRTYDMVIFKALLQGLNHWDVNNQIILENKKAFQILKKNVDIPFNNFDLLMLNKSLKQLEGFMGSKIKESDVDFLIETKLTDKQIEETIEYCVHDVEQTIEVFDSVKEEFDSQLSLITAFDLDMSMFNKTKAQISAKILEAKRNASKSDEFDISFPNTLNISDKYKHIVDWYNEPKNRNYSRSLNVDVSDVPHVFAWGGIHGAIPNYVCEDGIILCCDVASLYPSIMIEYNFLSRNVENSDKYKQIRNTRLAMKKDKNPMQAPYKIVLNATYGCMKDEMNDLFDPLMANNVCVAGQLLLLDLIEKIEPYGELIQSNTDGIFMKVSNMDIVEKIKKVAKEWEIRTRLDLEWDIYNKIYQKDVNNYIIIDGEGNYKSKGSYVKKLNNIDYDLPIVNNALINYFTKNKPLKDTILECDDLKEFQKIVKITSLYKYALHGDKKIKEKILRVFASNDENAPGVFKVKSEDKRDKIANTPDHCFIFNDEVNGVKCPAQLDKNYYVDLAEKRLNDFLSGGNKAGIKPKSEIKSVNAEVKLLIEKIDLNEYEFFVDFLVYIAENKVANKTQITNLAILNYFDKFWGNRKLLYLIDEFYNTTNKYSKTASQATKNKKIEILKQIELDLQNSSLSLEEQMEKELDLLQYIQIGFDVDKRYCYVMDVNLDYSPRVTLYCLSDKSYDKIKTVKIPKLFFNRSPCEKGDIIFGESFEERFKSKLNPDTESKNKFIKDYEHKEWWLTKYYIVNNFYDSVKS